MELTTVYFASDYEKTVVPARSNTATSSGAVKFTSTPTTAQLESALGVCVTAEQKKGLIDAFINFAKTEIGFKEGVACAGRGINAGLALKSAKDK